MVCLVMAAPLALIATTVGVFIGHGLRAEPGVKPKHSLLALSLSMPLALIDSAQMPKQPLLHRVTSELHVAAPPSVVWNHVVSFSDLPPPQNWIFRYGLAYPIRARIEGQGVGALRHCEFSTGAFVEPITVWNPPHHLAFSVTKSPSPMRETNPFGEVTAAHLNGYFASRQGEFRLIPTADGGTLLQGTTWYEHGLQPEWYWRLWGDAIIHRIHGEVLHHVANLAQTES
jgi:Polyketide cyclase / dehydrase and lipid transport